MRGAGGTHRLLVAWTVVLMLSAGTGTAPLHAAGTSDLVSVAGHAYPTASWAVGLVVPEGSSLQGGGKVRWEGVSNITAAVTLPSISLPDDIVYAVLSVMTTTGSVLQAAAGIRPDDGNWSSFAWLIPSTASVPLVYQWVLNASGPTMAPGTDVSISIYQSSGEWSLKVSNERTGGSVTEHFPPGVGASVRAGDQEVFALESYSRSGATFQNMGNLTLTGLFLDRSKVVGGVYAYSDWDPAHNPLFAVGSAGASPPSFVSFGQALDGSFVWGYATVWKSTGDVMATIAVVLAMVAVVLGVVGVVLWKTKKAPPVPNG